MDLRDKEEVGKEHCCLVKSFLETRHLFSSWRLSVDISILTTWRSHNFFSPKLSMIQSSLRFLSFSPSLLPFLSLFFFSFFFFGGEWWSGGNSLASTLGGQNKRNISTLDLPFRLFIFSLGWGRSTTSRVSWQYHIEIVGECGLLSANHPIDTEYMLNARRSLGCWGYGKRGGQSEEMIFGLRGWKVSYGEIGG